VFLPRIMLRSSRFRLLSSPAFPDYLYIYIELNPLAYTRIIRYQRVVRLLGNKGDCTPVPAETVASIQPVLDSDRPFSTCPISKPGVWLRVLDGPLAGVIGIILGHKENKRRLIVGGGGVG